MRNILWNQNLKKGIGIIFVRWDVYANYSWIPEIYFSIHFFSNNSSFSFLIYLLFEKLTRKQTHSEINAYSLCIFNIIIRYSGKYSLIGIYSSNYNIGWIGIHCAIQRTLPNGNLWRHISHPWISWLRRLSLPPHCSVGH